MNRHALHTVASILLFAGMACAQTTGSFTFGGVVRDYIVHAPAGLSGAPLVFNMHGLGSNASQQQQYTRFDLVADREGFIVVYPNGADKTWDITGNTDVGFLSALLDTIAAHYRIDRSRVYATGFSMGGYMSHRLGCAAANRFAAIAPVAGLNASYNCSPARPVPVLQIHGTADSTVKYSGVAATVSGWVNRNGCPQTAQVTAHYPVSNPNSAVRMDYYGSCDGNSEVVLLSIAGAGHVWPGGWGATLDINAGEEAWAFFKKHSLPSASVLCTSRMYSVGAGVRMWYGVGTVQLFSERGMKRVRVLDARGRVVASRNVDLRDGMARSAVIPLPGAAGGVYVIEVETGDGTGCATLLAR